MASIRQKKTSCNCKVYYETDWIISDETVVRPDIAIVCAEVAPNSHIKVTPALIVEVFSPSTRLKDRNTKFKLYESCGVKYYLMADPDLNKLEIFELGENGYREMTGNQFTLTGACNLSPDLSDIFEQ